MNRKRIGRTGIVVTDICMGTMTFGLQSDEKTSFAIMDRALDAGIDFFDTAEMYPVPPSAELFGVTEQIVGKWLKGQKRGEIILATKVTGPGHGWFRPPIRGGFTALDRRQIFQACEDSLRRLQTDYIDLYQSHRDDADTPQDETAEAFGRLVKAGKARAIGASNFDAGRLGSALKIAADQGLPRYDTLQPAYNLVDRAIEGPLQQLCVDQDVAIISYYGLASGFLTGKYRSAADLGKSPRGAGAKKHLESERGQAVLAALDAVSAELGATPAQVALAWVMARPAVAAPIASATSLQQLHELMGAARLTLDAGQMARLDAASS
jgi:aryl-alcohol dehydrogenase-like predicted oxidoreductase